MGRQGGRAGCLGWQLPAPRGLGEVPADRKAQGRVPAGPPAPPPHFPHCAVVQLGLEDGLFRGLQAPHARNMKMCHTERERKTETGFEFDWKARIWAYLPKRKGSI